jgi:hypothetical protein
MSGLFKNVVKVGNEKVFDEIINYLNNSGFEPCKESDDGRNNSNKDEEWIVATLLNSQYASKCIGTKYRNKADIVILGEDFNIKSSNAKTADNACSEASFFSLFYPDIHSNLKKDLMFKTICSKDPVLTGKDYYFLIVNKITKKFSWTSMLRLQTVHSNPSNPIQINWSENEYQTTRTPEAQMKYLISIVLESYTKQIGDYKLQAMEMLKRWIIKKNTLNISAQNV